MCRTVISLLVVCSWQVLSASIIDVFEATNGHEPKVAVACGLVPFYVTLDTGKWEQTTADKASCDEDKEEVKRLCQLVYPKLNITNIVEDNKKTEIPNFCTPGGKQCDKGKKIVPYRCLVNEYEADALMVPNGCQFDHLHDDTKCLTHDQWKKNAGKECKRKYQMNLKDYGILLSCKTDHFTGVEFVCCPKKSIKKKIISNRIKALKKKSKKRKNKALKLKEAHRQSFLEAIRKFMRYMPIESKGCDRTSYIAKQTGLEDSHRKQIAAVVNEWDGTEKRYLQLKQKDPDAAEEKMKRTLEVFRQTLAALEKESKDEKSRLRAEHAECINTQISKNKRDAMIAYMSAIQEEPVNAEIILNSVRKFIQVCEHDRVHSLRHFEHVRNRNAEKADLLRGELLQHLKDLNKVVNESMALLNYLPDIAQQFGLTGHIGGAILKPRLQLPVADPIAEHTHEHVEEILKVADMKYGRDEPVEKTLAATTQAPRVITEERPERPELTEMSVEATRKPIAIPTEVPVVLERNLGKAALKAALNKLKQQNNEDDYEDDNEGDNEDERVDTDIRTQGTFEELERAEIAARMESTSRPVTAPEIDDPEVDVDDIDEERTIQVLDTVKADIAAVQRSSFAFTVIMGLSGGVLVIMLFVIIAMVMRRRRATSQGRVIVAENDDDRQHLVEMQKNGFENPTYKFFYY